MASAQIVTLTLDEANAHDRKQQRVNQGHRQDQREGEIFRFVQRLRYLLIRDTQHLPKTSRRVTIVFQSGEGRATIAHWPIGQAHFDGEELMRVLLVHPSPLMYSEIYLRLEPLGMERVAAAVRAAGHEVRILDLQIFQHRELYKELEAFKPQAVGFSLNYLANVPEVIDLAKAIKQRNRDCFVFTGGHSGSFVADEILEHAEGAVDCVLRGEGEKSAQMLLQAIGTDSLTKVPGIVSLEGAGPTPTMLEDLDQYFPARDLGRRRNKYFIGVLDPCASNLWGWSGSQRRSAPLDTRFGLSTCRFFSIAIFTGNLKLSGPRRWGSR